VVFSATARPKAEVTVDLPSARVSLRHYAGIEILDRDALYDALDRADRLDLATHAFDEKGVLDLIRKGKLPGIPESAVKVVKRANLQVVPRKGEIDAPG
jgi:hypothetical protein